MPSMRAYSHDAVLIVRNTWSETREKRNRGAFRTTVQEIENSGNNPVIGIGQTLREIYF